MGLTSENKVIVIGSDNDYGGWSWTLKAREAPLVLNVPPDARINTPVSANEGDVVALDVSLSSDPDENIALYEWDLDNDGLYDDAEGQITTVVYPDDGIYTVGLKVTDEEGEYDTDSVAITVVNVSPSLGSILSPVEPVPVVQEIHFSIPFTDPGSDTWTASWDWGDGSSSPGDVAGFTVTGDHTYLIPGVYTVMVSVEDDDGGATTGSTTLTIVNVPPTVGLPVVVPDPSLEGASVSASVSFSDTGDDNLPFTCAVNYGDGSGDLAGTVIENTCNGSEHIYPVFGSYLVTIKVTDNYGETGSNTANHLVVFNWSGFFPPVDNPPTLNGVKAGQSIPVKFSLGGNKGPNIIADGYPRSVQVSCDNGATMGDVVPIASPGSSDLSYSPGDSQYHLVWKTEKTWTGTCRRLIVKLVDGTEHTASFKFK